ncbi:MAG: phospho-sugar mutase [Oscillospiraceae bacterium]|jgi:phosphoglucomutase|nr:phospho-sugar mutase [Oscillospiraceae bacterium]MCI9395282.1 phospho-sugar mutase [Oscillospiraceae bacterium]MCI9580408.1 phospho-sugar mutase [Oscillospiraceae bacterium]
MSYRDTYQSWLDSAVLSQEEKAELTAIQNDEKEIESRFFEQLSFGTAGLRGTMGMGLYRMNVYTVRHATQAFAQVILAEGPEAVQRGVAVCYDCRNNSEVFAQEAAKVMSCNGIPVRLFDALRPTPELSFAIREYGCIAGINITASHNPKEYNGYKVYWEDGAQLPPKHADEVAKIMQELDVLTGAKLDCASPAPITMMGEETDEKFLANAMAQVNDKEAVEKVADTFKMVYTPFHGTGHKLIPEALKRLGMKHVICVPEQMVIDGNFPTVASPNPENPEGFALAVEIAKKEGADFILGSDPDADRVGIMVNTGNGEFKVLTGNQTGVLLLDYLIGAMKRTGKLPQNPVALKTIVTTEMARKVAEVNGLQCFDTFTGFKFLAQKKDQLEGSGEGNVIMSYEESYGYMLGSFVRDKDAVTASVALSEMAAWYAGQNMTLYDALMALYEKYGCYGERTMNLVMPGLDGLKKMADLMAGLREKPPVEIAGVAVAQQKDYKDGSVVTVATGDKTTMELTGSNVLRYEMSDGTSLIVRPSGTEPKVKVYILANGANKEDCDAKVAKYAAWAESLKG